MKCRKVRRKKRPSKKDCMRIHAIKRLRQRFSIEATKTDLDNIIEQIESGRAIFIEKQSNRVSAFLVEFKNIKMAVIYDKQRDMVVTCMPPEYLENV